MVASSSAPSDQCLGIAGSGLVGTVVEDDRPSILKVECDGKENWYTQEQLVLAPVMLHVKRGHPARLREAIQVFEASGFAAEAQEARAQLPQVASAYLAARLAEGDMPHLHEAIFEAEAEGLSDQAAETRAQLPLLVNPAPLWNLFC